MTYKLINESITPPLIFQEQLNKKKSRRYRPTHLPLALRKCPQVKRATPFSGSTEECLACLECILTFVFVINSTPLPLIFDVTESY
ncbi:hypothetical protein CEXT_753641 [Caerostris extrusa]|uniref:Uncharacterized protein n=1 Tax=Caerostris extrusa TaxID=172846 RepID=A0AAV4NID9_CAEEX|nr:hypothetical protein CEXT_753641 [Caerostris extrusa]